MLRVNFGWPTMLAAAMASHQPCRTLLAGRLCSPAKEARAVGIMCFQGNDAFALEARGNIA